MRSLRRAAAFAGLALLLAPTAPALALAGGLKPYKDDLFAYPPVIETRDGGAYAVYDYSEKRDINERDEVPEKRVKKQYVSLAATRAQVEAKVETRLGALKHVAVGKREGARMIAVYVHGKGGTRKQGANDWTFGGNFNRLKNLMVQNGGLYLSPDVPDFGAMGAGVIADLIAHYAAQSSGAPVFVACGSAGGGVCHRLADDPAIAPKLGGLFFLGSFWDDGFTSSAAVKRRVPVYIGHGSRDPVFAVDRQEAFYQAIRATGTPVRFQRFETGTHGTPIRMVDWKEAIGWMMGAR
jgi:hypothetical protein